MVEGIAVSNSADRSTAYRELVSQVEALVSGETDLVANLGNISAGVKQVFDYLWVGFYLERNGQLVLSAFQGPVACTRIEFGQGVCGTAYEKNETIVVPDVDKFPGHIVCSSESRSEIVIPLRAADGRPTGVLDVDSTQLHAFKQADIEGLEQIAKIAEKLLRDAD